MKKLFLLYFTPLLFFVLNLSCQDEPFRSTPISQKTRTSAVFEEGKAAANSSVNSLEPQNNRDTHTSLVHFSPSLTTRQKIPLQANVSLSTQNMNTQNQIRCINKISLTFSRPMNIATLLGKITTSSSFQRPRPFIIESMDNDFTHFVFKPSVKSGCFTGQDEISILIADTVFTVDNLKLSAPIAIKIAPYFAQKQLDADSKSLILQIPSDLSFINNPNNNGLENSSSTSLKVKPMAINRAFAALKNWQDNERDKVSTSQNTYLSPLPIDDVLKSFEPQFSNRQYGSDDTIFHLRRAAVFLHALLNDDTVISVVDISERDGRTPAVLVGHQRVLLHPSGSHENGNDVDISYITNENTNPNNSTLTYDMEKNFWLLYILLQSSSVDLVMTAYKQEFVELARLLSQKGLISDLAVGRFNMLIEDKNLNHDKHFHINIGNSDNLQRSIKFQNADDVYTCYLSLRPTLRGGNFNYCL